MSMTVRFFVRSNVSPISVNARADDDHLKMSIEHVFRIARLTANMATRENQPHISRPARCSAVSIVADRSRRRAVMLRFMRREQQMHTFFAKRDFLISWCRRRLLAMILAGFVVPSISPCSLFIGHLLADSARCDKLHIQKALSGMAYMQACSKCPV